MIADNRVAELLRGQTATAQRVYSAVPMQEYWSTTQIHSELVRLGIHIDRAKIVGSLRSLTASGIVSEKSDTFKRADTRKTSVKDKQETKKVAISKQAQNALVKQTPPPEPSSLDKLADLSAKVVSVAATLKEIASEIDAAAIEIVEKKSSDDANVAKLKQLQALLKEIG